MRWTRVTVDAAVLTTAIWIQARGKADVRAVVVGNDRLAVVHEKLCPRQPILFGIPLGIRFEMDFLEAVWRIFRRAPVGGDQLFGLHIDSLTRGARGGTTRHVTLSHYFQLRQILRIY